MRDSHLGASELAKEWEDLAAEASEYLALSRGSHAVDNGPDGVRGERASAESESSSRTLDPNIHGLL